MIGGGLAGMAAAVALRTAGVRVSLLETRRYLGGRAASFRDPDSGDWVDLCQHVSLGCCTNLAHFCRTTGIEPLFRRERVLHFFAAGRQFEFGALPGLPAPLHLAWAFWRQSYLSAGDRWRIGQALWKLARMPAAVAEREGTVGRWLATVGQTPAAIEQFWSVVLISALGESLDRASLAAARKVFVDGFMAARRAFELAVPKVPLTEIYDLALRRWFAAHQVDLRTGCGLTEVELGESNQLRTTTTTGDAKPWDAVVLAVTWRQIGSLIGPGLKAQLPWIERPVQLESSPISSVHLWFDRPIATVEHAVLVGRTSQWVFQRSTPGGSDAASRYYQVVISALRELDEIGREQTIQTVIEDLRAVFPAARRRNCSGRELLPTRMPSFRSVRAAMNSGRHRGPACRALPWRAIGRPPAGRPRWKAPCAAAIWRPKRCSAT